MPNVMAVQPNIGGALCESFITRFLVPRRKVWLTPTTRVRVQDLDGKVNFAPGKIPSESRDRQQKLANRSQPLMGRSSPYSGHMWWGYCCLTNFFPIADTYLSCEGCAMVPRLRIFGDFCVLYFQRAACSTSQTCILNSH